MPLANPMRGEAMLGECKLVVNYNGLCVLEGMLGLAVPDVLELVKNGLSFSNLRTFVQALSEDDLTEISAGELIDSVGYNEALAVLCKAFEGYFAPPKKEKAANPLKAA
jgi:hypothetical protein